MKAAAGMAKTNNFEGVLQGQKMKLKNSEFQSFKKEIKKKNQE